MSEKLEITKERVLEAAADCPTAKTVLVKLFPEVFKIECKYKNLDILYFLENFKQEPRILIDNKLYSINLKLVQTGIENINNPSMYKFKGNLYNISSAEVVELLRKSIIDV